jgi:3-demethoxyubiquinol 3-hydroxylase
MLKNPNAYGPLMQQTSKDNTGDQPAITVFFDGGCPLCRREVGVYQRASVGLQVHWHDVNDVDVPLPQGLDRESALSRFHVLKSDERGAQLLSGARAFTALWQYIPGWKWLGFIAALPIVSSLLEPAYRGFLFCRPLLQSIARAFEPARPKHD